MFSSAGDGRHIGLKVLREFRVAPEEAQIIDIVTIYGIGAHPDDTWCKNVGTAQSPQWFNWRDRDDMLPAVAPNARIMRYGYQSQWFWEGAVRQKASIAAQRLEYPFRSLTFVAHCFGGLVVLKPLDTFGMPFRGAEGMCQVEMLEAARRECQEDEVQPECRKGYRVGGLDKIRGKRDLWLPRNIFDEQVFDLTYPFRMNKFGRAMEEDFETKKR
ncbi:hypothetical protein BU26DRAFT_572906 [Trematosphaeria pertusa]|uniref:Uncharacterized protein n=1 Tax=Trematosphaeria pertusa TaxID=390896 RepID=A0A6A6HQ61_9PLEO|nr:uncharacterized protein BU26DRAFT_572906 [Trematosphaeria pertusa]KAF2240284.1 hypothetical protein BU26DRAFT_572906 [Trematosphaeria pertusa]